MLASTLSSLVSAMSSSWAISCKSSLPSYSGATPRHLTADRTIANAATTSAAILAFSTLGSTIAVLLMTTKGRRISGRFAPVEALHFDAAQDVFALVQGQRAVRPQQPAFVERLLNLV